MGLAVTQEHTSFCIYSHFSRPIDITWCYLSYWVMLHGMTWYVLGRPWKIIIHYMPSRFVHLFKLPWTLRSSTSSVKWSLGLFHPWDILDQGHGPSAASVKCPLDPLLWGGLDAKSGRPWDLIHCRPHRTPCRFVHPFKLPWSLRSSSSTVKWSGMVLAFSVHDRFSISTAQALKL
jgi:hypothetical protein